MIGREGRALTVARRVDVDATLPERSVFTLRREFVTFAELAEDVRAAEEERDDETRATFEEEAEDDEALERLTLVAILELRFILRRLFSLSIL